MILALIDTPNEWKVRRNAHERNRQTYDPIEAHAGQRAPNSTLSKYDPLANV